MDDIRFHVFGGRPIHRKVIRWMIEHVSEHNDAPSLANAAIDHFQLDDPPWIWSAAQDVYDVHKSRQTSEKYD